MDIIRNRINDNYENKDFKYFDGCFLVKDFQTLSKNIEHLEVRDSDVWVTSFPKSGTTWTQEMVWLIVNDLNYDDAKVSLKARFPFLEVTSFSKYMTHEVGENNNIPQYLANSVEYVKNFEQSPRCIKTHLPWNLLPLAIHSKEKRPKQQFAINIPSIFKIIHVVRNPKDVCVSYYYHSRTLFNYSGTMEEFSKLFLTEKVNYCPYWDNVFGYWQQRNEPNVLFLYYEDMKKDLKATIIKVAQFLNKALKDDEIGRLMKHLSFESMRSNEAVNNKKLFNPKERNGFAFIRKGLVGGYKDEMSPETIKTFDKWIDNNNKGLFYCNNNV